MRRDTRVAGAVLPLLPLTILLASVIATRAIAAGASDRWRLLFRPLCHGIRERCLTLWGAPMPICARCAAIYFGLTAGMLLFWILPRVREKLLRRVMFLGAVPMAVDGLTQAAGLRLSTNVLRMGTGALAGFLFGWWVLTAIDSPVDEDE